MNALLLQTTGFETLLQTPITYLILVMTCITSYKVMEDPYEKEKFMFVPYAIQKDKNEWYRFFSHGLVHGSWMHLGLNMFVLHMFGPQVEFIFKLQFGAAIGPLLYIALYGSALATSSIYSFFKHRNDRYYRALGASGAISAVVFSAMLMNPFMEMGLILISDITGIWFAAFFFGILYLLYSAYKSKQGNDNIGHDAHYWGAVWGLTFTAIVMPFLLSNFVDRIVTGNFQIFYFGH